MKKYAAGLALFAMLTGAVPAIAGAQASEKLSIYGYLTQGYGQTDGAPIYGLTDKGTTDYRAMALQFRYAPSMNHTLVVQLGHRRLALSAVSAVEPDVALDWAFYQTRWAGNTFKVGRIPMPRGLFNEVRQVGVLFPFFRASKAFYSEGVETIDGLSVSRAFSPGAGFTIDAAVYGGGYDLKVEIVDNTGPNLITDRHRGAHGVHLGLATPITGLRFSADIVRSKNAASGGGLSIATASADYAHDRFFGRAEWELAKSTTAAGDDATDYGAWYTQGGIGLTEKLWFNAQYEMNAITLHYLPTPEPVKYDNIKDLALGLSYRVSPKMVLKGEWHDFKGYQLDVATPPVDGMGQPLPAGTTQYFILSLSTAF